MAKRFFTILVLPDATSPARKFQISKTVMTVVSSVAAVSILALTFFLYQYVNLNVRMLELRQLRQEASERGLLSERVSQLEAELSKIRELDQRLRPERPAGEDVIDVLLHPRVFDGDEAAHVLGVVPDQPVANRERIHSTTPMKE